MGKGGLDESIPQFAGVHSGAGTLPAIKEALESVDTVIWIGNYPSDFNTGEFTTVVNKDAIVIDLQRFAVWIGKTQYFVSMKHVSIVRGNFWQNQLSLSGSTTPRIFASFEPNLHSLTTSHLGSLSKLQLSGQRRPQAGLSLGRKSH
jgi:thiamine pyrophosphate-dependent acetolactate synthase large subunit-like protein